MSAAPQTPAGRVTHGVGQGFWALIGLSFIGFPAIAVFLLGLSLLLFVARLLFMAVLVVVTTVLLVRRWVSCA